MDAFDLAAVPLEQLYAEIDRRHIAEAAAGTHHTCMLILRQERPNDSRPGKLHVITKAPTAVVESIPGLLLRVAELAVQETMAEAGVPDPSSSVEFVSHQVLN